MIRNGNRRLELAGKVDRTDREEFQERESLQEILRNTFLRSREKSEERALFFRTFLPNFSFELFFLTTYTTRIRAPLAADSLRATSQFNYQSNADRIRLADRQLTVLHKVGQCLQFEIIKLLRFVRNIAELSLRLSLRFL